MKMKMKAVRLIEPGRPLEMQEISVPEVGSQDVLVRVKAAGVCQVPCVLDREFDEKSGKWACPYHGGKKDQGGKCGEPCGRRLVAKGYPIKLILEPAPADALDPEKLKDGAETVAPPVGENPPR